MRGIIKKQIYQASCENCGTLFEDDGHNCYDSFDEITNELIQHGWTTDFTIECPNCNNEYYQQKIKNTKTSHL